MKRHLKTCGLLSAALIGLGACSGHISEIETNPDGLVVERIYNSIGGHARSEYDAWRDRKARHDIHHYIIDGSCASFCSFMALSLPSTCYTKSVRLGVHPASIGGIVETEATRAFTRELVSYWPKGLQDWWATNRPSVLGQDLVYEDLKRIIPGRECGPEEAGR